MAADWTPSQPSGVGSGTLNTDLEDAWVGEEVFFNAEPQTSYEWAVLDLPDGTSVTLNNDTSQICSATFSDPGCYGITLLDPASGQSRTLTIEVRRDGSGALINFGVVAPRLGQRQAGSVGGRGVAHYFQRALIGVMAAIAAVSGGPGADLDPTGDLEIGRTNPDNIYIGHMGASFGVEASGVAFATPGGFEAIVGGPVEFLAAGPATVTGAGITLQGTERLTDDAPYETFIMGGGAYSGGSAANTYKTGGKVKLVGGWSRESGTDTHGDVQVSLGHYNADGEAAAFSVCYGDSTLDLFEHELLRVSGYGLSVETPTAVLSAASGKALVISTNGEFSQLSITTSGDEAHISMYSGADFQMAATGMLDFTGGRTVTRVTAQRPNTDVPAPGVLIQGTQGTSTSTVVTANQRGGYVALEAGYGKTPGTHPAGPIFIGIGTPVSNTIANGLILGYGAAINGVTDTSYQPFTTEMARLRLVSSAFQMESALATTITSSSTMTLTGTNQLSLTSASGPVVISSNTGNTCSLNGGNVEMRATVIFKVQNAAASFDYLTIDPPNNRIVVRFNVTDFRLEERITPYTGTTSSTSITALTGAWGLPPGFTNGLIRLMTVISGTSLDGSRNYSANIFQTFKVVSSVVTDVSTPSSPTVLGDHESNNFSNAYHDWTSSTFRLLVSAFDSTAMRWEAITTAFLSNPGV